MKFASYLYGGRRSYGVVTAEGIRDRADCFPDGPAGLLELLREGPQTVEEFSRLTSKAKPIDPNEVSLLAPIPQPPKILALAGNYVKHIKESRLDKGLTAEPSADTTPRPFLMPATAVAAPGEEIPWPCYSREIDYEVELAVVIGAECKCVSPDDAVEYVAGYTIANDVSARSTTFAEGRADRPWDEFYDWLNGKWADGFCPMGPYLVTPDEVGDPDDLDIELAVNGRTRQKENTGMMIFDVRRIISFLSHLTTLTPGDVIATGTPSGVGMADGNFLAAGDVMTCRIEKIGELTNTLGKRPETFYTPCKDVWGRR